MADTPSICVVGAGLAGCMVASLLSKLYANIDIYEKRENPLHITSNSSDENNTSAYGNSTHAIKRSINLALSYRGMEALKEIGLLEEVLDEAIRMSHRVIHTDNTRNTVKQPYGKPSDALYSVSRQSLNNKLLQYVSSIDNVTICFNHSLIEADKSGLCTFVDKETNKKIVKKYDLIIGADGAYSGTRDSLLRQGRINFSRKYIEHGYKELSIPPVIKNGVEDYALEDPNGLHIWPRGKLMLIALPNADKSFTATLFAPYQGPDGFESVDSNNNDQINKYVSNHFPDVVNIMPNLSDDFSSNPVGSLVTIRVSPWNCGRVVLIGDAAHAVVPFYGQGMNAAFEDALVLYELYKQALNESDHLDFDGLAKLLSDVRSPATNSLADLCVEHYSDMACSTTSNLYLLRRKVEGLVSEWTSSYFMPLYTMIAFTRIPYHEAVNKAKKQEKIIYHSISFLSLVFGAIVLALSSKYISQRISR
eukprot:gene17246-22774_t